MRKFSFTAALLGVLFYANASPAATTFPEGSVIRHHAILCLSWLAVLEAISETNPEFPFSDQSSIAKFRLIRGLDLRGANDVPQDVTTIADKFVAEVSNWSPETVSAYQRYCNTSFGE